MPQVHWSLEVRGRLRPKAVLVDADGRDLARVTRDGLVLAVRAGGAKDADGRSWRVVGPPDNLRVSCGGVPRATVLDGLLEVGDRAFGWRVAEDGTRTARVTSTTGGGTVLRIDPGDGGAWARISFDDGFPEPFAVVLAAVVRLLEAEDPIWGPGGPGAGGRKARAAAPAATAASPAGAVRGTRAADATNGHQDRPGEGRGGGHDERAGERDAGGPEGGTRAGGGGEDGPGARETGGAGRREAGGRDDASGAGEDGARDRGVGGRGAGGREAGGREAGGREAGGREAGGLEADRRDDASGAGEDGARDRGAGEGGAGHGSGSRAGEAVGEDGGPKRGAGGGGAGRGPGSRAGEAGGDGDAPRADAARLDVEWALFVQGRARPRVLLSDGRTDPVATLDVRGGPAGSLGVATDRDGRRWVAELDGGVVTMRCAGRAMARAEGETLTVGGRTLNWQASLEGARTATASGDDGAELLRIARGPGGDGPWATVELDDMLPSPLAATLASLFVLLRVEALGRRG